MKKILLLVLLSLILKIGVSQNVDTINYLIQKGEVLGFKVNASILNLKSNSKYKIIKISERLYDEILGETCTYTSYIVRDKKENLLKITEDNCGERIIAKIAILSKKFKTIKGIGIGSTLDDFIKAYPNYSLYCGSMCYTYELQEKDSDFNFILDKIGILDDNLYCDPGVPIKSSAFKSNTKIVKIFL
ncbi:MAG: hypothetical protein WBG43_05655 [Marinifilaceae bacterium]